MVTWRPYACKQSTAAWYINGTKVGTPGLQLAGSSHITAAQDTFASNHTRPSRCYLCSAQSQTPQNSINCSQAPANPGCSHTSNSCHAVELLLEHLQDSKAAGYTHKHALQQGLLSPTTHTQYCIRQSTKSTATDVDSKRARHVLAALASHGTRAYHPPAKRITMYKHKHTLCAAT